MKKGLIFSIVILLAIFGLALSVLKQKPKQPLNNPDQIINYKEPSMNTETRKTFEEKLEKRKNLVAGITDQTKLNDKYLLYADLANSYYTLGFYKEAKEAYLKALAIYPNEPNALHMYSILLAAMNDKQGALETARKAVNIQSTEPDPWNWLITLEEKFGNATFDQLDALYVQAIERTGAYPDILVSYATFLERYKKYNLAINYWQKAQEKRPEKKAEYQQDIDRLQKLLNQK